MEKAITHTNISLPTGADMQNQLLFLLQLSDALRPLSNPVDIEEAVTKIAMDFMDADWCHYVTIEEDNLIIQQGASRGDLPSLAGVYPISSFALFKAVLNVGLPFIVDDVHTTDIFDEELKQLCIQLQNISFVIVPVVKNGKPVGLLSIVQRKPRKWTDSEVQLTIETAERTWAAVERAKAEEALRQSEEKYRMLFNSMDEGFCTLRVLFDEVGKAIDCLYLEVNTAFVSQSGLENVVGKTMLEVNPETEKFWIETYGRISRTGKAERFEHIVSGLQKFYEFYAFRFGESGENRVAVIFNNITERKNEEDRQTYLLRLSDALRELTDPLDIQCAACQILGEHMQVTRVVYGDVVDEQKVIISNNYVNGVAPIIATLNAEEFGLDLIATYRQNEKLIISNVHTDPRFTSVERENFASLEILANASLGLLKGGRLVATLGMHQNTPREWSTLNITLLEETAERTWAAVERAKAEEALRKSEEQIALDLADTKKLQAISTQLIFEENIDLLYQQLVDAAIALMKSDMASIQLYHPEIKQLELITYKGFHPESAAHWKWINTDSKSICSAAMKNRGRSIVSDLEKKELTIETGDLHYYQLSGIKAVQSTPLISRNGDLVGMISTHWREPHQPSQRELQLFDLLTRQAADLIERKKSMKKIKESEYRFHELIYSSASMMAILKGEDMILEIANDAILATWGKGKDVIGKSIFLVLPEIIEQGFDKLLLNVYKTGEPYNAYETPVTLLRNGISEIIYYNFVYQAQRNVYGLIEGVAILANEVTPQALLNKKIKVSEQRYHTLFMQSPFAFSIMKGKDMKVTLANDLMKEFWGKGNNVEEKTLLEILPELSNQPFPAMIDSVYTTGVPVYANEILAHLNRNGVMEDKYFNIVYEPHFEADNTISGVITIAHEVTQQVLARKNIEESETLFKLALFLTAKTVFKQDIQLRYTWIYNTHTSLEMKDLVGKTDFDLFSNDAAGILTTIKQTVLNTGNTFNGDIQIEIDGKPFDFAMMVEATKDVAGKINGIIAVSDDITEKKQAENKIKESEQEIRKIKEQLELSIRAGKIGVWHWDIKNDQLYWSKEQKAIYGLEQSAELLNVAQYKALVIADDWERLNKDLLSAPIAEEQEYDFRIIRKNDGEIRWIKSRARNIVDQQGALQFISGVNIDITEQVLALNKIQESEERFRSLAQSLPQLVWVTDAKGTLEFASNRWKEYSGIVPNGEKEWKAIVHPDDYDNINAAWIHSLSTGAIYYYDVRLKNKNGEYKWHTAMGEPVVDIKNNIVKWVGAFINTHAEKLFTQELELKVKQRTNELEQFNIELERKNKQLQSFSYVASHDLQEPLRKIQSFAVRIIENEYNTLSKNGKDYFKRMQDAAYQMQTLIQDLLTYSSTNIAEGKLVLTNLNKIIDQVKEDLSEALKEKQVSIEATELCNVKIIPFQLYQLMHNLLGNAVKFSLPNTPVHIIIKSVVASGVELFNKKLNPQLNYCHISITDNGIGFEQEYSEKIFEVFQRLHGKEEYAGTGIGLSIVKKIVDNHSGIVTATSQLNKGATFDIYIPA